MTDLTEQWNKGELKDGKYWVQLSFGGTIITAEYLEYNGVFELDDHYYEDEEISKVLAPVPDYEEWRDLKDDLKTCDEDLNNVCEQKEELYEENAKLKELLKECKEYIDGIDWNVDNTEFFAKIDEVLK